MAVDLQIIDPVLSPAIVPQRIAPIRFARAVVGFADATAPDLDDHGFVPGRFCSAHGPVVGIRRGTPLFDIAQGPEVRVKVIRDRLDDAASLFPTIEDHTIAEMVSPGEGDPLDNEDHGERLADCLYFRGTSTARTTQETVLKIHHGTVDGPVLAEMAIRVYPVLTIRVQPHQVSINGQGPTTTLATIRSLFDRVNRVYAQAGVHFEVINNFLAETVGTGVAGSFTFQQNGTVTLSNTPDAQNVELQTVLTQNPTAGALNMYVFGHYNDIASGLLDNVLGIAFSRDSATANPPNPATGFPGCGPGITVRDSTDPIEAAHTVAHEIGHALRLEHYALGNGSNGTNADQREDIWAHRCLMYNIVGLVATGPTGNFYQSSAARTQVGYGGLAGGLPSTGQLLTTKSHSHIQQSDQINVVRAAVLSRSFAPL